MAYKGDVRRAALDQKRAVAIQEGRVKVAHYANIRRNFLIRLANNLSQVQTQDEDARDKLHLAAPQRSVDPSVVGGVGQRPVHRNRAASHVVRAAGGGSSQRRPVPEAVITLVVVREWHGCVKRHLAVCLHDGGAGKKINNGLVKCKNLNL